jgi:hypothetical protein
MKKKLKCKTESSFGSDLQFPSFHKQTLNIAPSGELRWDIAISVRAKDEREAKVKIIKYLIDQL